jgi:cytochrome b6-f complex iron-sulfur subunit
MDQTRRDLLEAGWTVGTGMLVAAAGWTSYVALKPLAVAGGGGVLPLLAPDAYPEGSATFVRQGRLFVTRAGGELRALAQKCPHLGCAVPFCDSSGQFECPCHGSVFNAAGEWVSGPSPRGMDRYPLQVADGRVLVNTSVLEEGAPLGSKTFAVPARGPSCAAEKEG